MESRLVWRSIPINAPLFDGMSGKGTVWVVPLAQHERPRLTTSNRLYEEDGRKEVYPLKKAEVQLLLPSIYLIQRSDAVGYTGSCDTSGTTRTL